MDKPRVFCSQLPRIMLCPESIVEPVRRIDTMSDAARVGIAFHDFISEYISLPDKVQTPKAYLEEQISAPTPEQYADIDKLCQNGAKLWDSLSVQMDASQTITEQYFTKDMGAYILCGRLDAAGAYFGTPKHRFVLDWKTCRDEVDATAQMIGYAALMESDADSCYSLITAYPRLEKWTVEEMSPDAATGLLDRLESIVNGQSRFFNPSENACCFCPRAYECPECIQEQP